MTRQPKNKLHPSKSSQANPSAEGFCKRLYGEVYVEFIAQPAIVSWSQSAPGVMRMVVDAPSTANRYSPVSATDLISGGWGDVPHSDDGVNPFLTTNLAYSTLEGTNEVIYVETNGSEEFFKILGE